MLNALMDICLLVKVKGRVGCWMLDGFQVLCLFELQHFCSSYFWSRNHYCFCNKWIIVYKKYGEPILRVLLDSETLFLEQIITEMQMLPGSCFIM